MPAALPTTNHVTYDTLLPTLMGEVDHRVLKQAGVVFHDTAGGNEQFTLVTLPAGWQKAKTDQGYALLDIKGRQRAVISLGGHCSAVQRYAIATDYAYRHQKVIVMFVTDGGTDRIYYTKGYAYTGKAHGEDYQAKSRAAHNDVLAWLDAHYPNWEDP